MVAVIRILSEFAAPDFGFLALAAHIIRDVSPHVFIFWVPGTARPLVDVFSLNLGNGTRAPAISSFSARLRPNISSLSRISAAAASALTASACWPFAVGTEADVEQLPAVSAGVIPIKPKRETFSFEARFCGRGVGIEDIDLLAVRLAPNAGLLRAVSAGAITVMPKAESFERFVIHFPRWRVAKCLHLDSNAPTLA
jgi:hypothetical protein